jgi:hypothetical protein
MKNYIPEGWKKLFGPYWIPYVWSKLTKQSTNNNIFRFGKRKTPVIIEKEGKLINVKLGSGFASYTLETSKEELQAFILFIQSNL